MDFSKLNTVKASENTYRFEVTHPITGEGTGAMIVPRKVMLYSVFNLTSYANYKSKNLKTSAPANHNLKNSLN